MSGGDEFAELDLDAEDKSTGDPLIDPKSHVRLAHPITNNGAKLLRPSAHSPARRTT